MRRDARDPGVRPQRGLREETAEGTGTAPRVPVSTDLPVAGDVTLEQGLFGPPRHPTITNRATAVGEAQGCSMESLCPAPRLAVSARVPAEVSLLTHAPETESGDRRALPARHACHSLVSNCQTTAVAKRTPVLLGPTASPCTDDRAVDSLKHLGAQAGRQSEVSYAAGEVAGTAVCVPRQAAKKRKRAESTYALQL